jgi:hypothetical protein
MAFIHFGDHKMGGFATQTARFFQLLHDQNKNILCLIPSTTNNPNSLTMNVTIEREKQIKSQRARELDELRSQGVANARKSKFSESKLM